MSPELRHLHKINMKLADVLLFLDADNEDIVAAIQLTCEAKELVKEAITEAEQYG